MPTRRAFRMQLFPGTAAEYQQRHEALWPELREVLKESGIRNYSIFLDEGTHALFGVLETDDPAALDALPRHPVMQRWWAYMADLMETHPDHAPVQVPLREVFHLD